MGGYVVFYSNQSAWKGTVRIFPWLLYRTVQLCRALNSADRLGRCLYTSQANIYHHCSFLFSVSHLFSLLSISSSFSSLYHFHSPPQSSSSFPIFVSTVVTLTVNNTTFSQYRIQPIPHSANTTPSKVIRYMEHKR